MTTHNSSSLLRTRLMKPITESDTTPFDMEVSGLSNVVANGFLTVSPGTSREEIMEYTLYDVDTNKITIVARGINPGVTPQSSSTTYYKPHYANDEVRGDVNHLHFYEAQRYLRDVNSTYTGDNTHTGKEVFNGEVEVTTNLGIPTFADTTERDTAIPSPEGDEVCKVNGNLQWYNANTSQWESAGTSTPVPNATETNKGISETATQAETDSGLNDDATFVTAYKVARSVQKNSWKYAESSDITDSYTVTLSPSPAAYVAGMEVVAKFSTANTGACTINVNGLGAKSIKSFDGGTPVDGEIASGSIVTLRYDGTNFVLPMTVNKTHAIVTDSIASSTSRSNNTVYQESVSGFVTAYVNGSGGGTLQGYTDSSNPPTTKVAESKFASYAGSNESAFVCFPVKKGDYWKVTGAGSAFFFPMQ